jgi:hypothetical protein
MEDKIVLYHHHNKIRFAGILVIILLAIYLGFTAYTSYYSYYGNGQCRNIFDSQPVENRKRICCNPDHYNAQDELCKIKCDTLDVRPDSDFCKELTANQSQSPLAKEIEKPKPLSKESPKCTQLNIFNYDKNEETSELKPNNPLNIKMLVTAKDIQPSYFVYEFFTIEGNDISTIKPISFSEGKTLMAVNPVKFSSSGEYTDSVTALHNFFYKENLRDGKNYPKDVLVVTSIIDEKGNKQLQPSSCFGRFTVDQTPTYCKSFSLDSSELDNDKDIKLSIQSNSPTTYSYEFKFLNLRNYETSDGDKIFKPLSFQKVNNSNEPYSITKLANGQNKISFDLQWDDFYKKDLNNNNKYPKEVKVAAYIKPSPNTPLNELVPCYVEFQLGGDDGIDNCEDISISGGTKNSDGSISLKSGQYITIKSESKSKNITNFLYTFHNLDNLNSSKNKNDVKDASEIYFSKSNPFEISKSSSKSDSKSILVSYDDLNKIDLSTGSKPKNIQVRTFFTNSEDRISKLDSKCVSSFKMD